MPIVTTLRYSGAYALGDAGSNLDRTMRLELRVRVRLSRQLELRGVVDAPGLAKGPARGTLELGDPAHIELRFGKHRLRGQQPLSLRGYPAAITELHAQIVRNEVQIGRALLRFDLRADLARLIGSFGLGPWP